MKAQIDEYKGWQIWGEWEPGERFVENVRWYALTDGETVTLEAHKIDDLRELIDMREGEHGES